jgi:hypothetical protein
MADDLRVSLLEALAEYAGLRRRYFLVFVAAATVIADVVCSFALYASLHPADVKAWAPERFWRNTFEGFDTDSADILLLLALKLLILPAIAAQAIRKGKPPDTVQQQQQHSGDAISSWFNYQWQKLRGSSSTSNNSSHRGAKAPLLDIDEEADGVGVMPLHSMGTPLLDKNNEAAAVNGNGSSAGEAA